MNSAKKIKSVKIMILRIASLVKPNHIFSSSHGTDIGIKDKNYFYVRSQHDIT